MHQFFDQALLLPQDNTYYYSPYSRRLEATHNLNPPPTQHSSIPTNYLPGPSRPIERLAQPRHSSHPYLPLFPCSPPYQPSYQLPVPEPQYAMPNIFFQPPPQISLFSGGTQLATGSSTPHQVFNDESDHGRTNDWYIFDHTQIPCPPPPPDLPNAPAFPMIPSQPLAYQTPTVRAPS